MFPIKRFIQGPSLHEETIDYRENVPASATTAGTLSGHEASKAYEEIINLPSTSNFPNEDEDEEPESTIPNTAVASTSKSGSRSDCCQQRAPKLSQLMTYCESNNYNELEKHLPLLNHEITINTSDEYGWTMLMSASCAGSTKCVSLLLQKGADWKIKDKKGLTAQCLAEKNRHSATANFLRDWNEWYGNSTKEGSSSSGMEVTVVGRDESLQAQQTHSLQYCDFCKVNYGSPRETHEKCIAHLLCTGQFGDGKIHYGIPESNRGFQLMVKSGWDKNTGLGPEGKGHKFPVKTVLKRNKLGLGNDTEKKAARITHFGAFDPAAVEEPPERLERDTTIRKRQSTKLRIKERRKEIDYRREFSSL